MRQVVFSLRQDHFCLEELGCWKSPACNSRWKYEHFVQVMKPSHLLKKAHPPLCSSFPPPVLHRSFLAVCDCALLLTALHLTQQPFSLPQMHTVFTPLMFNALAFFKGKLPYLPQSFRFSHSELTLLLLGDQTTSPPLPLHVLAENVSVFPTTAWALWG